MLVWEKIIAREAGVFHHGCKITLAVKSVVFVPGKRKGVDNCRGMSDSYAPSIIATGASVLLQREPPLHNIFGGLHPRGLR